MLKKLSFIFLFFFGFVVQSQTVSKEYRKKTIQVVKDTIQLDSVALNPERFTIFDKENVEIKKSAYQIDFSKAQLIINSKNYPEITVEYYRLPEFITKTYSPFSNKLIIQNSNANGQLYSLTTNKKASEIQLFDGLQTKGFITRGVIAGNNQNVVTNSALDLEIAGKLSRNVSLRANIFDTNVPIQQNGVSQNITDFDRIFIEMYTENWRVKAGDLSIVNNETFFFPFMKQVSGLEVEAKINDNLNILASGAVVRGKFNTFRFTATEGNQGPYKIFGANNEANILIIEGSEQVYVNGRRIQRGENQEYTMDYNLGEITFNTTFPITNDLRIWIDFQYAERNYTRFITYNKADYTSEKLNVSGYFYNENDVKSQPIQQALTQEQQEVLANAGNNTDLMFAESAFPDTFDVNKILYRKVDNGTIEFFEYSTDENENLFNVSFTNVGANNGDYVLDETIATGNIYRFVGANQGDFSSVVRLIAPTKSQMYIVTSDIKPNEKTNIDVEIAVSNRDENLFSTIDDTQNYGLAAKVNWQQVLIDKDWKLTSAISHEFAHENFYSEQVWEPVEFNRDWNIITNRATKNFFQTSLDYSNKREDFIRYTFNQLNYDNGYRGTKHNLKSTIKAKKTTLFSDVSYLQNTSDQEDNFFFRARANAEHQLKKSWFGAFIDFETNSRKNVVLDQFVDLSHRYKEYEAYYGIGDTTKIFAKFGVNYRTNDSIRNNSFAQINNRKTVYVNSKLIKNKNTDLSLFANYRITENNFRDDEKTLNSRLIFTQKLFENFISLNTVYETSSGNVARQDFVYVQVEPGLGYYTWIDYNNDGVRDFNEFEVAQFQDQANYLRLPKPNLRFIPTQRAKWQQSMVLNPRNWNDKKGVRKLLSYFYNQTFLTVENEQERRPNSFQLNPFDFEENSLISLNLSFRNSLYFNKDLQKHSVTFTYGNTNLKQQFLIGNQENDIVLNQLDYAHRLAKFWVLEFTGNTSINTLATENFPDRNYELNGFELNPKVSYELNKNNRFSGFYHFKNKENLIGNLETLDQQKFGLEYYYIGKYNNQISANATIFLNDFVGNTNSPVAYQMLEGLQAGRNYTWNVIFNQKLNSFLNLNVSYLGRKSENSRAIHTGNIQLRANF